ncbi:MAG TPA: SseB family protein, partial [Kineosporiaceae bacterium]|nr:SseB family protein [Kineosporiaceae bacterium]
MNPTSGADSAGVPWSGRTLTDQPFAGDDGSADPALAAVLADGDEQALAEALAAARVLVPVVAVLGEERAPVGPTGLVSDKSADMAVATLVGRDGRKALPVFSSLTALAAWDARARPV